MANFADSAAGLIAAGEWARAKVADGTWVVAHEALDKDGHPICRFQRFMAPTDATTKGHGAWVESRADDAT